MTCKEQKHNFERDGYLVVENLLSAGEVETCQSEVHRLHELATKCFENDDPRRGHFQLEPYANQETHHGSPILRKIEQTGNLSEVFFNLAQHPDLVKTVQNLIGEDLLLFRSTLMLKPALFGSAHGLHQDSAYWPMDPPALVSVSIALNDATPENGCFKVIPKSHLWGLQEWGRIARRNDEPLTERTEIDQSEVITVPLSAGSTVLFHSLLAHESEANLSPHPRNTALYAYCPSRVRLKGSGQRTFRVVAGFSGKSEVALTSR